MIDFRPDQPKSAQVLAEMRRHIKAGVYKPGYPIPGEPRMAEEFGIARRTARNRPALDLVKRSLALGFESEVITPLTVLEPRCIDEIAAQIGLGTIARGRIPIQEERISRDGL
ncbi:GntR family transcriptional regulator [Sphaerisporangium sp. NPDC051017]|uniref:GntR family transcriptional regulator n=1 Tax=Sphaerisporangium sp. NPDC051017 TaxID=3154636 RepID=UPI00343D98B0